MVLLSVLVGACQEATTVELGPENGVVPIGYAEVLEPLPSPLTASSDPVVVEVVPEGAERVSVTIRRDATFLDEPTAALYQEAYGVDGIERIRGIRLTVLDLRGAPALAVGTRAVEDGGVTLEAALVDEIKDALLAPRAVRLPLAFIHHLPLDQLDALGTALTVRVVVQPTLTVDAF